MGKKAGVLRINPTKFGSMTKPCMKESIAFLSCLTQNHANQEKCIKQKELLNACINEQSMKKKNVWGTVNYQMHKLSRGNK